jgi:hypothetical protein
MAQLSSPGVSVTVIDESFYTPAAPGTTPLIIVASEESKSNGSGTGTAPGTLKANAGNVYLLTSQKDLSDTFGTPMFMTDASNNPVHAGEQNEFGLQAAYSFLGVSNRAFVVRADIDLGSLDAQATAPAGTPDDGTFWFDTANTNFGIFEWNSASAINGGQVFTNKIPTVITDRTKVVNYSGSDYTPKASIGAVGDYAMVCVTNLNKLWYKKPGNIWVAVGSSAWASAIPAAQGTVTNPTFSSNTLTIGSSSGLASGVTTLTGLVSAINTDAGLIAAGITAASVNNKLTLYSTGAQIVISGTAVSVAGLTVGTYDAPALQISAHTSVPLFKITDLPGTVNGKPTGSVWVKTTNPNLGADWIVKKYSEATGAWSEISAPLYPSGHAALAALDATGGGLNLSVGALYVHTDDDESATDQYATFKIYARRATGATIVKSAVISSSGITGSVSFTMAESLKGSASLSSPVTVTLSPGGTADDAELLATAIRNAGLINISVTVDSTNRVVISHVLGGDIRFDDSGTTLQTLFPRADTNNFYPDPATTGSDGKFVASNWTSTVGGVGFATASATAITTTPADDQLWYNSIVDEVDIMIHNGTYWKGYKNYVTSSNAYGPQVSATAPKKQSDGVTSLVDGDLWISTADLENYPQIYRYNGSSLKWVLIDSTDQTTENGILFHDARWATDGSQSAPSSIVDLLSSDYLDPDAPDPALYPRGMLLWNLRRSGFNVKRYMRSYVDTLGRNLRYNGTNGIAAPIGAGQLMSGYYANRWVSDAANNEDGSGCFGRKAQRKVVVQALQALVNANQQIRDEESRIFNLIATPGYPELVGEMVSLNYDRGLTAFVVADTPARLTPDATTLNNWGTNQALALEDNDLGLVSSDEYLAFFYPWGYTSDNIGNNIVVPPSHMILRTIALSDNVSYPWFAPAGTRRGGITNATAVGYVSPTTGEFQAVALNNGQRDTLASIKVNPITFITGTGLVNYGQYTRAKNASSLDRINVARLVVYLRRQFSQLAKPYVFEPNDKITRDELKQAAESLLLELVGQRALYDYLVVCDTSNNTPSRIDRNELYLDVAIEPVKAVEFIYIPLRLKNTGEIKGL